jgi:hypothetical protein
MPIIQQRFLVNRMKRFVAVGGTTRQAQALLAEAVKVIDPKPPETPTPHRRDCACVECHPNQGMPA